MKFIEVALQTKRMNEWMTKAKNKLLLLYTNNAAAIETQVSVAHFARACVYIISSIKYNNEMAKFTFWMRFHRSSSLWMNWAYALINNKFLKSSWNNFSEILFHMDNENLLASTKTVEIKNGPFLFYFFLLVWQI